MNSTPQTSQRGEQLVGDAAVNQPPSENSALSLTIQRGTDELVLLIEREKAKMRDAFAQELAAREKEHEEFRRKTTSTLTAAFNRVNANETYARNKIAETRAEAESALAKMNEAIEQRAACERDVQHWRARFLDLEKEHADVVATKNADIQSLNSHISWLEARIQDLKLGTMQDDNKEVDTLMADTSGQTAFATGSTNLDGGGGDIDFLNLDLLSDEPTLQDETFMKEVDDLFLDTSVITSSTGPAPFSLSPSTTGFTVLPSPTLRSSPAPPTDVVTSVPLLASPIPRVPFPSETRRKLIIPPYEPSYRRRSFKMRVSPLTDEERRTCVYVRD